MEKAEEGPLILPTLREENQSCPSSHLPSCSSVNATR